MSKAIQLNSAFREASESDKRYRILYGGAGSGKSHFVAQEILLNMLEDNRYRYLVVRNTAGSIRLSVFQLMSDLINEYGLHGAFKLNKTEMSVTCYNGATMVTSGLDDVEKLKSIANINRIWIEEATEISETDFNQLDLRLRGTSEIGYQMTATFNPVSELHWLKKRFFDIGDKNAFVMKSTYLDNPFIDDEYRNALVSLRETDMQYYKIYALAEWGSIGNLVFSNWKKADLSDIRDTFDNHFNGLDFGFSSDPTAFVRAHLDSRRKKLYIVDEMYLVEEHLDSLAVKIDAKIPGERITCDSSEPRSIADLRRRGVKAVPAKKGAGSVEHGIKWLQGYEIIVDERCKNMILELTSYRWREDKDGNRIAKPVDDNNHLIDALRYAMETEMLQNEVKVKMFRRGL